MRTLHLVTLAIVAPIVAATTARAQDDRAAGLFAEGRLLPMKSQSVRVDVRGPDAELVLEQVFVNDGADVAQADYRVPLPQGAVVAGFGFWKDGRLLEAKLQEKAQAERAHEAAASSGRTTGIAHGEGPLARFSVFPVAAGSVQRVQLRLRMPVSAEAGRSHVLVPVDGFLGQARPASTIVLDLKTQAALASLGADCAALFFVNRGATSALAAASSTAPVDLWWTEEGAPLVTRATTAPLGDGRTAVEVLVRLNDASALVGALCAAGPLTVFVDGSRSMERKRAPLDRALARLRAAKVVRVGDGFSSSWSAIDAAARAAGCYGDARCAAIVDAQLEGLDDAVKSEVPTLVLASADEAAWQARLLARHPFVHRVDADPDAALLARVDELVLPVLTVTSLEGVVLPGKQARRAAEGGMVRLAGVLEGAGDVKASFLVGERALSRTVPAVPAAGDDVARVRRAAWERILEEKVERWKQTNDAALRQEIVDESVREGVTTELVALQVDEPTSGFVGSSAPEPATWAATLLAALLAMFVWRRAAV